MKVYNLSQAMDFFLENASGSCICVSEEGEKEVFSYSEAKKFYN